MTLWLVDTSAAIPLVATSHSAHAAVNNAIADRDVALAAHSALETYSVLTRLPLDARLAPHDAALLISERFGAVIVPDPLLCESLLPELADLGIAGGAVYDALIAVTARGVDGVLITRDRRAKATYSLLGVPVELIS